MANRVDGFLAGAASFAVDRTVQLANRVDLPGQGLRIGIARRTLDIACNVAQLRDRMIPSGVKGIGRRLQWSDFNPLSCEAGEQIESLQAQQKGKQSYYHLAGGNRYRRPTDTNGVTWLG